MTAPPSGWPPPTEARLAGRRVELAPLAAEVADRYFARHPEDLARYGADVARAWEMHDTQHLVNWAIGDVEGFIALDERVTWLADVLAARAFPLDHLAGNLEIAADVVEARVQGGAPVAERLRAAAALVRAR
ncbi:MAG TPA: hypothetical protein VFP78_14110 [Solirubrobacteraceae bacterium]|nr:hypothetical protein [Solirubrobacteraceae bacterium]